MIEVIKTPLEGLLLLKPKKFGDSRGFFYESWRKQDYIDAGISDEFLQDNCSFSERNVLRGLHIQKSQAQILWPTYGHVYQVLLDVRRESKTYGQHFGIELKHTEPTQVYMPAGFAGGFKVLSDVMCMNYKCTRYYNPKDEGGVLWSDPDISIKWPGAPPILSERDQAFPQLKDLHHDVV